VVETLWRTRSGKECRTSPPEREPQRKWRWWNGEEKDQSGVVVKELAGG
jgi:hypothetical protein